MQRCWLPAHECTGPDRKSKTGFMATNSPTETLQSNSACSGCTRCFRSLYCRTYRCNTKLGVTGTEPINSPVTSKGHLNAARSSVLFTASQPSPSRNSSLQSTVSSLRSHSRLPETVVMPDYGSDAQVALPFRDAIAKTFWSNHDCEIHRMANEPPT